MVGAEFGKIDPVLRGVQVTPVAVGLTSWITTDYVAENMHLLEFSERAGAFMVYFACGVHFLGSFLIAAPIAILFAGKERSWRINIAVMISLFSYIFWTMLNAQTMVSELFTEGNWRIPIPGAREIVHIGRQINETGFLFYFPLSFSWTCLLCLLLILSPLALFDRRGQGDSHTSGVGRASARQI